MSESIYHKCNNCLTVYYENWDDVDCPVCNGDENVGQGIILFKELLKDCPMNDLDAITALLEFYAPENIVDFCLRR